VDPRLRGDDDKNGAAHGQKVLGGRLGVVEKLGISEANRTFSLTSPNSWSKIFKIGVDDPFNSFLYVWKNHVCNK
jgi:hypothetical protein